MKNWVERMFFDGKYFAGGIPKRDIPKLKAEYRAAAHKVLDESGADHVVYCYIDYDSEGEITMARFYSGLKMSDAEFDKTTGELTDDFFVGAVHNRNKENKT